MNRFKVGDEVLVKGKIDAISPDFGKPWINFEDWHLYLSEKSIVSLVKASTAIPEGWNSSGTLENLPEREVTRNVQLLRENGQTGYGWRGSSNWYFTKTYNPDMHDPNCSDGMPLWDDNNPVIGWKELETKPTLPDGWNTRENLENQPNKCWTRNVQIIRADGTQGYGYRYEDEWFFRETASPHLYEPDHSCSMSMIDTDKIVGWKELELEKPTCRLKIGDKIVHKNHLEYGTGTIFELDYDDPIIPYNVKYSRAEDQWTAEENAVKVDL